MTRGPLVFPFDHSVYDGEARNPASPSTFLSHSSICCGAASALHASRVVIASENWRSATAPWTAAWYAVFNRGFV